MRYITLYACTLSLIGCSGVYTYMNTHRSTKGPSAKVECNRMCQERFHSDVDWIGEISGDCYCK
jgi:hypothetical protein